MNAAITAIVVGTLFMVVRYVLKMITHLPDNLPRWIGGQGNNVGDSAAADRASQSTENSLEGGTRNALMGAKVMRDEQQGRVSGAAAEQRSAAQHERQIFAQTGKTLGELDQEIAGKKAGVGGGNSVAAQSPMGTSSKGGGGGDGVKASSE